MTTFQSEITARTQDMRGDPALQSAAMDFLQASAKAKYSYNFQWMGRPIIQYPQDIVAMQELIHEIKPDLVIETGIAHGGSLIFSAATLTSSISKARPTNRSMPSEPGRRSRSMLWLSW